jgi:ubiquinone/menaquinone biosynthesis C-methylase UbiE
VLAPAAHRLLGRVADRVDGPGRARPRDGAGLTVLDLGAGTGSLALGAAERWPGARIIGLDASAAMLSVARHRAERRWPAAGQGRFEWMAGDALELPLEDGAVDVVVSSFVVQLVPDRGAVLREVRRVLRPSGVFGVVTWLADDVAMAPDEVFDEAVYDLELDDPEPARPAQEASDFESLAEALEELEAAGFVEVDVQADRLEHSWSRGAYRDFKEYYDELDLFEALCPRDRARLLARLDERWAGLPDDAFTLRAPIVSATARRR